MTPRASTGEPAVVSRAATALRRRAGGPLDACVVLGSGVAGPTLEAQKRVPLHRIPGLVAPSVEGHGGQVHFGTVDGLRVAVFTGRVHLYEGRTPAAVVRPVRAAARAGARFLLVTNASGSLAPRLSPSTLLLLSDHLDFSGGDPAVGEPEGPFGPRFTAMAGAYDADLRAAARTAARRARIATAEGVYAFRRGPGFETAAEVRALRTLGADAVGFSTVPDVLAARRLGMRVFALSVVSNRAGSSDDGHESVLRVVRSMGAEVTVLLDAVLAEAAKSARGRERE